MNTTTENDFFPSNDYRVPVTTNYMRLVQGANKFRVLSSAIVGFEYFTKENKPIRSRTVFDETPNAKGDVKHFWAFLVWNYDADRVQILELSQKSIQTQMQSYISNPDWGNPKGYDITINRKGTTKNDTEYQVMPSPHKEVEKSIKDKFELMKVDLNALYNGEDPFTVDKQE